MAIPVILPPALTRLPSRRGPAQRLLEDERWLALVLLVPTLVLLGMFIAYPFVRGILLSVTSRGGCARRLRRPRQLLQDLQ